MKRRLSLAGPVRICTIPISAREGTSPRPVKLGVNRGKAQSELGARCVVRSFRGSNTCQVSYFVSALSNGLPNASMSRNAL